MTARKYQANILQNNTKNLQITLFQDVQFSQLMSTKNIVTGYDNMCIGGFDITT